VRKLVIALFCIALLVPSRGNTLGLGEIELHSSLNEELNAEIALLSIGQESAETIIVKLASKAEFNRAGIDRPFILNDLKFTVKVKNDKPYIEVTSKKSIREPFLSFLLDIDWPRGHILREFTLLLDPPVFMQASAEGAPTKTVVSPLISTKIESSEQTLNRPAYEAASGSNSLAGAPATAAPGPPRQAAEPVQARAVAPYRASADGYRVQRADTAWKIAERLVAGKDISIEQMMMALLRRNPEAFIQDNINGIKRGYILRVPDQQDILALDNKTALIQVKEQYALWREYRQSVVAKRNANKIERSAKTASKAASGPKGHLKITSAAEGESSEGATSGRQNPNAELKQLRQDLAAASEELESGKLENEDLKERVASLQARMKKMQRLLNLKDGDLANLQSDLSTDAANEIAAEEKAAEVSPPVLGLAAEDSKTAEAEATITADSAKDQQAPAETATVDAISSTQPAEEAVFMDEMTAPAQQPLEPVPSAAVPPAVTAIIDDIKTGDWFEKLLKDPNALPVIVGVPALALLLVLYMTIRNKRKKSQQAEHEVTSLLETGDFNFADVADMVDADSGFANEQADDLGDQLEAFAEEAEINLNDDNDVISLEEDLPAEEVQKDDVLAEADVYLAYGIYQQAEELLKTAVAENPERADYKIKLLETFFASKDKSHYASLVADLQPQIDTQAPEWQRIVAMGRELDPGNALFSGGDTMERFDVDDLLPEKPETDFDLGEAAADFDLGDSIDDSSEFDLDLEENEIDVSAALTAEDVAAFDSAAMGDGTDNFALNDDGLDELDQELAAADDMDFDLSEESEPVEELDDAFSLDFDMADLGMDEASAEISAEETEVVASSMVAETEDFGLGRSDNAVSLDNTEAFEMDLGELSRPVQADDISMDDVSLDMGDIDLGEIDLSIDEQTAAAVNLSQDDDETIDISRLPEDLDEVNTKLDLARAYIDMGDSDGASSILREVIEEAAGEQKQTAESMLKDIA